ncbi:MAG: hypothetical protein ACR2PF_08990 [Rhizobiaceae bacterium]
MTMPFSKVITASAVTLGLGLAVPIISTSAEARPSTRSFTCQGVQDYVQRRGAVVMNTKSPRTYRRFVANRTYCSSFEITETRTVPTKTGGCYLRICWEKLNTGRFKHRN